MATSQSGGVTSLPYINTVTPVSTDDVPLYTSTEPLLHYSVSDTGGSKEETQYSQVKPMTLWLLVQMFYY